MASVFLRFSKTFEVYIRVLCNRTTKEGTGVGGREGGREGEGGGREGGRERGEGG